MNKFDKKLLVLSIISENYKKVISIFKKYKMSEFTEYYKKYTNFFRFCKYWKINPLTKDEEKLRHIEFNEMLEKLKIKYKIYEY